jgi:pimeloyl-ACP methyl ester carboxylesterase
MTLRGGGPPPAAAFQLRDGRALGYREWGDPDGSPVIFVHGSPGSSLWCPDSRGEVTRACAVRLISLDRPGFGGSDVQVGLTVDGWTADVAELADAIGLDGFGVVGVSAGGPWAAACAALLPERLTGVGLVSSRALSDYNVREQPRAVEELNEEDRHEFELVRNLGPEEAAQRLVADYAAWTLGLREHPERAFRDADIEADRWFFQDPMQVELLYDCFREYARQGPLGAVWESVAILQPWSFRLADIPIPVHLWHGEKDSRVRLSTQQFAAETIPDARLTTWPDVGHLGMAKYWQQILEAVTAGQ